MGLLTIRLIMDDPRKGKPAIKVIIIPRLYAKKLYNRYKSGETVPEIVKELYKDELFFNKAKLDFPEERIFVNKHMIHKIFEHFK